MAFSQYLANEILTWVKGQAFPAALSNVYISLHSGDPGTAGTSNDQTNSIQGSANRTSIASTAFSTVGAASGGGFEITNSNAHQMTSSASNGSPITVTHFGVWDAQTSGNFLASGALTASVAVSNGDTVQFNAGAMAIKVV
jgi:hypothetical protein